MRCFRHLVCLYAFVGTCALDMNAYGQDGQKSPWPKVLKRGLMLYCQGQYSNAFDFVYGSLSTNAPAPEIDRCMALLRKSFVSMHNLREPIDAWNSSSQAALSALEAVPDPTDTHIAVLAILKYHGPTEIGSSNACETLLDTLIRKEGPWHDWAVWRMSIHLGERAMTPCESWGVVRLNEASHNGLAVLDDSPSLSVPARAATELLKSRPDTYMYEELCEQICLYYITIARRSIMHLAEQEWLSSSRTSGPFPLSPAQKLMLRGVEGGMADFSMSFCSNTVARAEAEARLDDVLWHESGDASRVICEYLKQVAASEGMGAFPPDVAEWLLHLRKTSVKKYDVYPDSN